MRNSLDAITLNMHKEVHVVHVLYHHINYVRKLSLDMTGKKHTKMWSELYFDSY